MNDESIRNAEYLKWSSDMDRRIKETEEEEKQDEKFHHRDNSEFVLQEGNIERI